MCIQVPSHFLLADYKDTIGGFFRSTFAYSESGRGKDSPMHFAPKNTPLPPAIIRLIRPEHDKKSQDGRHRPSPLIVQHDARIQHPLVVQNYHQRGPSQDKCHLSGRMGRAEPEVGEKVIALASAADALHLERVLGVGQERRKLLSLAVRSASPLRA